MLVEHIQRIFLLKLIHRSEPCIFYQINCKGRLCTVNTTATADALCAGHTLWFEIVLKF